MTVAATFSNPPENPVPPGMRSIQPRSFRIELTNLPPWAHPEVVYWYPQWTMIRDAAAGERAVKAAGTFYLPALEGMAPGDYNTFKDRATYYNFTGRTVSALSGSIFRRAPVVEGLDKGLEAKLAMFARDGTDFETFASLLAEEVMKTGRYGVLLDMPSVLSTDPNPYAVGYTAENILDWEEGEDPKTGRIVLKRVVLREANETRDAAGARQVYARYRELVLEATPAGPRYVQYLYVNAAAGDAELTLPFRGPPVVPTRRGEPLAFIPFRLFGPHKSSLGIERPPMEDIATLNLSHYRSYAYLEHGRFFAGFPIYTAEEPQGGGDVDYEIGSSKVWVIAAGGSAKVLELNGQGLKFLENALEQKEAQAATLGGRMMDVRSVASSESDNALKLKERNEQSILLKLARQLDIGFSVLLRWWGWWQTMLKDPADRIEVTFNKDFLFDGIGAREFRAIQAMYKDGIIPIEVVYHYLRKANVIPDWMRLDEFKGLLDKMASFPNQPDAEARAAGFPNMQAQLIDEQKDRELDIAQQEADTGETIANKPVPKPAPGSSRPAPMPGKPPGKP